MAAERVMDLEDLARRYDAQVLREYLLEQQDAREFRPPPSDNLLAEDGPEPPNPLWPEVHDLRPRCFRRLRVLLLLNFAGFWTTVVYTTWVFYLRVTELGAGALPTLEVCLLGLFTLGTQATLEFAAAACLTQPARASDPRQSGFKAWDAVAWLTGLGARAATLMDAQCLPLMYRGSSLLFVLSTSTFFFAIGIFSFFVQLRLVLGLFCASDQFSYDKPDLFFKGRDALGLLDATPLSARPPANSREEEERSTLRIDRVPPVNTIKVANCAHLSDWSMLHGVLTRLYIPMSCLETQEFTTSITSFSRCFCEDVVQCSLKFFFLMDCETNLLVLFSMLVSACQALMSCFYFSTSSVDTRGAEDDNE